MPATQEKTQPTAPADAAAITEGARDQLSALLEQLRPAHEEFQRIEDILDNFDAVTSGRRTAPGVRAGRGERPAQFLAIVKDNPGITVAEAAKEIGVQANYFYRIAKELTDADQVTKDEKGGYTAVESSDDGK